MSGDNKDLKLTHLELIKFMNSLHEKNNLSRLFRLFYNPNEPGYMMSEEGICHGVSVMFMKAVLENDLITFRQRLQTISSLIEQNILPKQGYENQEQFKQQLNQLNVNFIDLKSFFDGITIGLQPGNFPHIFPELKNYQQAVAQQYGLEPSLDLLKFSEDEQFHKDKTITGCYSYKDLITYFECLTNAINKAHKDNKLTENHALSVAFEVSSPGHSISLGFDIKTQTWSICDTNQLNELPNDFNKNSEEDMKNLAEILYNSFPDIAQLSGYSSLFDMIKKMSSSLVKNNTENKIGITSNIFLKTNNHSEHKDTSILEEYLKQDPEWQKIHDLSLRPLNFFKSKTAESWLHLAAANNEKETVKILLEKGTNVNCVNNDYWTPIMTAKAFGHQDIVQIIDEWKTKQSNIFNKVVNFSTNLQSSKQSPAPINQENEPKKDHKKI